MHSVETKDGAASEFLDSTYVLDQRCWGVKYDIWGSAPNGWDAVHFVYNLKKQKCEAKAHSTTFFRLCWVWKGIWGNCLVFTPMNLRIHSLFQIIYFRQYMQCSLESVCVCVCLDKRNHVSSC